MKDIAANYYRNGLTCSESVVQAAIDKGLCDKYLISVASAFSGGMSSGCLCGAIAGAQMVLGANYGKNNSGQNQEIARAKAKEFIEEFKKNRSATCCKVLSSKFDFHSPERKQNCTSIVSDCSQILEKMFEGKVC